MSLAAFRKSRGGAASALASTVQLLVSNGVLREVPKQQVINMFDGSTQRMYHVDTGLLRKSSIVV